MHAAETLGHGDWARPGGGGRTITCSTCTGAGLMFIFIPPERGTVCSLEEIPVKKGRPVTACSWVTHAREDLVLEDIGAMSK